jgi:hypothetical protein
MVSASFLYARLFPPTLAITYPADEVAKTAVFLVSEDTK